MEDQSFYTCNNTNDDNFAIKINLHLNRSQRVIFCSTTTTEIFVNLAEFDSESIGCPNLFRFRKKREVKKNMTIMTREDFDFIPLNHPDEIQVFIVSFWYQTFLHTAGWRESFARSSCSIFFQEFS